ncbi:tripartite tricarboxylate transporter substrate binding protein [Variovorax paradoxus]|uniref:Bug family tripartite tricarboxylate transporter substrate binding protein n=1 Tax=Variovorax paradoxus TaxID=34073 RepID=UPI00193335CE|nr:tripartite tricarboxylate transporter substrate binding protein [Variovorax paradoxus]
MISRKSPVHALCAFVSAALAMVAGVLAMAVPALAADYPVKPIKMVIPYPPGAPDAFGRLFSERLSKGIGQPVIVENKAGAGGGVGAQAVARSAPDGYSLLFSGGSLFLVNPYVYKNIIYERAQFAPISVIAEVPFVVLARKDLPANNLKELAALMKKEPGKLRYGNSSLGSQFHMFWAQFAALEGVKETQVMLGGSGLLPAILNGDVDITVLTPGAVMQYLQTGQMKALAITSGFAIPALSSVQTVTQAGYPTLENVADYFLMAPKGTPKPVIDRLMQEVNTMSADPTYTGRLADFYAKPGRTRSPDEFSQLLDSKTKEWGEIVKKSGVTIE